MVISQEKKDGYQKRYMGGDGPETMPEAKGSGIKCGAVNCDHNEGGSCGTTPEISAGGACMTYSKQGEAPMEETPGEESSMPMGGAEEK